MAKFRDTTAVSQELTLPIKSASDQLFLVSPYLQIASPLQNHIND